MTADQSFKEVGCGERGGVAELKAIGAPRRAPCCFLKGNVKLRPLGFLLFC